MTELKIILVDNNEEYAESLQGLLQDLGFLVEVARSAEEAYKKLGQQTFDLLLADLRLKDDNNENDISGLEVARKSDEFQIPCFIITAFDSVETTTVALRSLGVKAPAVDYIPKKEGPDAILKAIHRLFGISLLHISDLHPKLTENGEVPFDQEQAYNEFLDDLIQQTGLTLNPIHAVIVSGDISFQCKAASFDWAQHYLEHIALKLEIPKTHIVLTPGNHDINRIEAHLAHDSQDLVLRDERLWFSKFENYLNFTRKFYDEPAFSREKLYRIFTFDERVSVVSFNSCLVEGNPKWKCKNCSDNNGKEHYHGWIDRQQVKQAAAELDAQNWNGLRIGVFHHHVVPDDWQPAVNGCQGDHLWSYHQSDQRLKFTFFDGNFRILLHGHRHKVELRQSQSVGSSVPYNFGSGAFWKTGEQQQETANYLILQLSPLPNRSRVVMRQYYPATSDRAGYWGVDDSIQTNGIIYLPGIFVPSRKYNP